MVIRTRPQCDVYTYIACFVIMGGSRFGRGFLYLTLQSDSYVRASGEVYLTIRGLGIMLSLVQSRIQSNLWALQRGTEFQKRVQTCIVERLYQIDYATPKAFGSSSETHRPVTVQ